MRSIASALASHGVEAVYGDPVPGVPTVVVAPHLARLLADAHRAVRLRPAATAIDGVIRIGDVALSDLGAPEPVWCEPPPEVVEAVRGSEVPLLLVGGRVLHDGAVAGVHDLAVALGAGVLNTVAAKGTFDWRSRHHFATVGLQRRDLELAGVDGSDLLIVSGLEPGERRLLGQVTCPIVEVATASLAPLAELVAREPHPLEYPPLRAVLGGISQEGWVATGTPVAPSRVTRNYAEVLGPGALIAADAGDVGYWVGRTYTTMAPAAAVVAATRRPGFAVAAVLASRFHHPLRPALAVMGPTADPVEHELIDLARANGLSLAVERWSGAGDDLDGVAHAERLATLVAEGGESVIAPDPHQLARMEAVAGAVDAWAD